MNQRIITLTQSVAFALGILAIPKQQKESEQILDSALSTGSEVIIPVTELKKSRDFYQSLGCSLVSGNDKSISMSGGGLRIRLSLIKGAKPSNYPILVWRFADERDDAIALRKLGITIDPAGDWPGGPGFFEQFDTRHYVGICIKDPDGNPLAFVHYK